jgi:tetratricopeptide (TPR) repeat protein
VKTISQGRVLCLACLCIMLGLAACGSTTPTEEPPSAEDHFRKGNEFSQSGDFEKAVEEYTKALELEPENVDAMSNLGVTYYNLGQLDEAIEQYSNALELAPRDADIHSNLAAAYVQKHQQSGAQDQLESALEQYTESIELEPNLAEAHFGQGVVYVLLQRYDEAILAFTRFQELDTGKDPLATENAAEYLKQLRGQ